MNRGGSERGRHRIGSRLQAPGSEPSAQSLTRGSNSRTVRSWPELKSDAQPTEQPRRPRRYLLKPYCVFSLRLWWHELVLLMHFLFYIIFFIKKIFFNVYLFLRQRETEHEQGRVRERETQNLKQALGSELSAQSPTQGSNSRALRSWPEPKSDA